jgi:hypothetical protein
MINMHHHYCIERNDMKQTQFEPNKRVKVPVILFRGKTVNNYIFYVGDHRHGHEEPREEGASDGATRGVPHPNHVGAHNGGRELGGK